MQRLLPLLCLLLGGACASSQPAADGPPPAAHGMVVAPEPIAAREGAQILREGGNAVDAAVCVGFVLAVTHPQAGNLGGGGFLIVHTAEADVAIDARETAPAAAERDMYLDADGNVRRDASLVGPLAAGVPGSVAGYLLALEQYGTLPRERVLAPAIRLAEEGFEVDRGLHASLDRARKLLARFPETAAIFLPAGRVPAVGERFKQPQLARTLRSIAAEGAAGFYRGRVALEIEKISNRYGGRIRRSDLAGYRARERAPVRGTYRGYEILSMPPPSSGGVILLQMLSMLRRHPLGDLSEPERWHLFIEVARRAFADRSYWFGDPDFVSVPVAALLDPDYIDGRFARVDRLRATPSSRIGHGVPPGAESEETCHFSIVDRHGNAVACTTTLNGSFGCGASAAGVLLNNEMDDFSSKPGAPNLYGLIQGERNAVAPNKRPLSSMTPTIVLDAHGRVRYVLGSPGGPTIISSVCQVLVRLLALRQAPAEAVAAPRVHHQWLPDEIQHEELPSWLLRDLEKRGHKLRARCGPMGDLQLIVVDEDGRARGYPDPRGRGGAAW
ncbi:MAG: gamma-glutamyltransferase [Planctomycetota bacterium]|nr:gamma-glutamyltransferase [Planctomycetota bacterium]